MHGPGTNEFNFGNDPDTIWIYYAGIQQRTVPSEYF